MSGWDIPLSAIKMTICTTSDLGEENGYTSLQKHSGKCRYSSRNVKRTFKMPVEEAVTDLMGLSIQFGRAERYIREIGVVLE